MTGQQTISSAFPDGASSTAMFADKSAQCSVNAGSTLNSQSVWAWSNPNRFSTNGVNRAPFFAYGYRQNTAAGNWVSGPRPGGTQTGRVGYVVATNFGDKVKNPDCGVASSPHTGGIMVSFGDGSVRPVAPEVGFNIWFGILTPNGGEKLGDI